MSSPALVKPTLRRSACDPCRAKRVRCLRPQDSTAACARCSYLNSPCVTGAPGQPGRPPKRQRRSSIEESQPRTPVPVAPITNVPPPASRQRFQEPQLMPAVTDDDTWAALALSDSATFFGPFVDQSLDDSLRNNSEQCNPLQLQPIPPQPLQLGLLRGDDDANAIPDLATTSSNSSTTFDMDMDLLLEGNHDYGQNVLSPASPQRPRPQRLSVGRSVVALREDIDQHIAAVEAYYKDPAAVQQWCMDETGQESPGPGLPEHPPAALLTCSKKFIDILQTLTPADTLGAGTAKHADTETLLQVLSGYLALMRLFDVLFHGVYQTISKMALLPPVPYEALRVRSVLRIGGVSALQDMPLKAYAVGILEAIYGQMRTIEKYLGVPTKHCLNPSGAENVHVTLGLFSPGDRARLFETVMAQEDIQSRRGGKSYVESIRKNIEESMTFFDHM